MEGKLIKKENHYYFWSSDWNPDKNKGFVANSEGTTEIKLSLKNCEAIKNGYDLDKLAEKYFNDDYAWITGETAPYLVKDKNLTLIDFKKGFRKALEILGDKKFSEEDMRKAFESGYETLESDRTYNEHYEEIIQSLQQTEWVVEVHAGCIWTQIDVIDPITHTCNSHISKGDVEEPMLGEDGCLILRRIKC